MDAQDPSAGTPSSSSASFAAGNGGAQDYGQQYRPAQQGYGQPGYGQPGAAVAAAGDHRRGLVGLLVMALTQRHQRLGDMLAKTLVVRA